MKITTKKANKILEEEPQNIMDMCQQISEVNSQMPAQEEAINDDEFKRMYNFEDQELKK